MDIFKAFTLESAHRLPNVPAGEDQFASGVISDTEQLVGGSYRHWVLDWEAQVWRPMPALDEMRTSGDNVWIDGAASVWAGDGLLVVGGAVADSGRYTLLDDAWIWRPRR